MKTSNCRAVLEIINTIVCCYTSSDCPWLFTPTHLSNIIIKSIHTGVFQHPNCNLEKIGMLSILSIIFVGDVEKCLYQYLYSIDYILRYPPPRAMDDHNEIVCSINFIYEKQNWITKWLHTTLQAKASIQSENVEMLETLQSCWLGSPRSSTSIVYRIPEVLMIVLFVRWWPFVIYWLEKESVKIISVAIVESISI